MSGTELQTTESLELKKINTGAEKVAELKLLASKYQNLIVTEETLDEADKARLELYRVRIDIQRDEKFNNDILNKAKKINGSNAETLINLIQPMEKEIMGKIDLVKQAVENRKKEEAAREQNRINEIKGRIAGIEKRITEIRVCESEQTLDQIALEVSAQENKFSEFNEEGNSVVKMALTAIQSRKLSLKEAAELAAKQAPKAEAVDNAVNDVVVTEKCVIEDEEMGEHKEVPTPLGDGSSPAFGRSFAGDTRKVDLGAKPWPSSPTVGTKVFKHMGYEFILPGNLPAETETRIIECLTEIIDEMPI